VVTQSGLASVKEGAVCNINTDVRQSNSVPDESICCHEDSIKVFLKEELCSDYASEGYKCIDQSKCVAIDPRQAGITKPEAICPSSSVRQTGDASETKICCHQADIKKSCSEYAAAGFR
jgi:hypothetical protein